MLTKQKYFHDKASAIKIDLEVETPPQPHYHSANLTYVKPGQPHQKSQGTNQSLLSVRVFIYKVSAETTLYAVKKSYDEFKNLVNNILDHCE